jgi:hypothetical protein
VAAEKRDGGGVGSYLVETGLLLLLVAVTALLLAARMKGELGGGPAPPWAMLVFVTVGLPLGIALVWALWSKSRGADFDLAPRVVLFMVLWNLVLGGRMAFLDGGFGTITDRLQEGWGWATRSTVSAPVAPEVSGS